MRIINIKHLSTQQDEESLDDQIGIYERLFANSQERLCPSKKFAVFQNYDRAKTPPSAQRISELAFCASF